MLQPATENVFANSFAVAPGHRHAKCRIRAAAARLARLLRIGTTAALLLFQTNAFADDNFWACGLDLGGNPFEKVGGFCTKLGGQCSHPSGNLTNVSCQCEKKEGCGKIPFGGLIPQPPDPKAESKGEGKVKPTGLPASLPASPFPFSLDTFEPGTFSYSKTIDDGFGVVPLTTLSFDGTLIFTLSADPRILHGQFLDFEWLYQPFDLPSGLFLSIDREVLDPTAPVDPHATLNLDTGRMVLTIPVMWLTTGGDIVSRNLDHFDIQITPDTDPTLVNVEITDSSTLRLAFLEIPEPMPLLLMVFAALFCIGWRSRKRGVSAVTNWPARVH